MNSYNRYLDYILNNLIGRSLSIENTNILEFIINKETIDKTDEKYVNNNS